MGYTNEIPTTFINKTLNPDVIGDLSIRRGLNGDFWFNYLSPNGDLGNTTIVRSPIINASKVNYCKVGLPAFRNPQTAKVTIPTAINGGQPLVGEDYILRFIFYNLGIGGQECQYLKESGAYRARLGDTVNDVFNKLVDLARKNFLREPYPLVTFLAPGDSGGVSGQITITAVEQPWVLGHKQGIPIPFKVECVPVMDKSSNVYIPWGEVTDMTSQVYSPSSIINGKTIADMEWFYLGERADHRRGYDYPDNFITKYVANPAMPYDTLDLDFYLCGDKEDVQKSRACVSIAINNLQLPDFYDLCPIMDQLRKDMVTILGADLVS
jgi:hypothetical protein